MTRARNRVELVDDAIDAYRALMRKRTGDEPTGFIARTLAQVAQVDVDYMSAALQDHRRAQRSRSHPPRYVVASERYGVGARWLIVAIRGSDPAEVQLHRPDHAVFVARDCAARLTSDLGHEIRAAHRGTDLDEKIEKRMRYLEERLISDIEFILSDL
jgi:hypothetical protein